MSCLPRGRADFIGDVFLMLDEMMSSKLLLPICPDCKMTLALREAKKAKRLVGYLRYLWRASPSGGHPAIKDLKALLTRKDGSAPGEVEGENEGGDDGAVDEGGIDDIWSVFVDAMEAPEESRWEHVQSDSIDSAEDGDEDLYGCVLTAMGIEGDGGVALNVEGAGEAEDALNSPAPVPPDSMSEVMEMLGWPIPAVNPLEPKAADRKANIEAALKRRKKAKTGKTGMKGKKGKMSATNGAKKAKATVAKTTFAKVGKASAGTVSEASTYDQVPAECFKFMREPLKEGAKSRPQEIGPRRRRLRRRRRR